MRWHVGEAPSWLWHSGWALGPGLELLGACWCLLQSGYWCRGFPALKKNKTWFEFPKGRQGDTLICSPPPQYHSSSFGISKHTRESFVGPPGCGDIREQLSCLLPAAGTLCDFILPS